MGEKFDTQLLAHLLRQRGLVPQSILKFDERELSSLREAVNSTVLMEQLQASEYRNNALVKQVDALKAKVRDLEAKEQNLKKQLDTAEQVKQYALKVVEAATHQGFVGELNKGDSSNVSVEGKNSEPGSDSPVRNSSDTVRKPVQVIKVPVYKRKW